MKTIAVFGQYKTGTTAVFHKIRQSLPREGVHQLFEPERYTLSVDPVDHTVLAKVILGVDSGVEYEDFLCFDHAIYITRDPRDWMISGLLFLCQQIEEIWSDEYRVMEILSILQNKEADPSSVSVYELLEKIVRCRGMSVNELFEWIGLQQRWLTTFESRRHFDILRYEHFVAGNYSELESCLGTSFSDISPELPANHSHTARTCSFGNWKDWFVASDVAHFEPLLEDYLERHDYDRSWQLNASPVINPEHGSRYVRAMVDRRRSVAKKQRETAGHPA